MKDRNSKAKGDSVSLYERLKYLLVTWLNVNEDQVVPEASLIEDFGADSLALVELVMSIEDEFNFRIPSEDVQYINTVQDMQEYIEKRIASVK